MSKAMNQDEVGRLPQEELENRYQGLISYIERERRKGRNHADLEIDACYLYRELDHRCVVSENHRKYLQNKGVRPFSN
jgi:hypothetical protein